jgi:hypothetical protein
MTNFAIFLYTGPETIMPLTSVLAAIVGVLLMLWHRVVAWVRTGFQHMSKSKRQKSTGQDDSIAT